MRVTQMQCFKHWIETVCMCVCESFVSQKLLISPSNVRETNKEKWSLCVHYSHTKHVLVRVLRMSKPTN